MVWKYNSNRLAPICVTAPSIVWITELWSGSIADLFQCARCVWQRRRLRRSWSRTTAARRAGRWGPQSSTGRGPTWACWSTAVRMRPPSPKTSFWVRSLFFQLCLCGVGVEGTHSGYIPLFQLCMVEVVSFRVHTLLSAVYGGGGLIPGTHPSFSCVWWGVVSFRVHSLLSAVYGGGGLIPGTHPSFSCVWVGVVSFQVHALLSAVYARGGLFPGTHSSFSCVCVWGGGGASGYTHSSFSPVCRGSSLWMDIHPWGRGVGMVAMIVRLLASEACLGRHCLCKCEGMYVGVCLCCVGD